MFSSFFNVIKICTMTPPTHLHQFPSLRSFAGLKNAKGQDFPLIDYLKKSCGLSSEKAFSVSKTLQNKNFKDPDSVLTFLRNNGFSQTHIANVIAKVPVILLASVESTLMPKFQFLEEKGLSKSEIVDVLSSNPFLLLRNLDKKVKPLFDFLQAVSAKNVTMNDMFKHYNILLRINLEKIVVANVNILKEYEVPSYRISELLVAYPRTLTVNVDRFTENLKMVTKIGFEPSTHTFLEAVRAMATMSKSTWEAKFELYKSLGWSEEEIISAFQRHPSSIMISKEKIKKGVNFFVRELGWGPSVLSTYPKLLILSLEKRIIPRLMVVRALESEGLVKDTKILYCFIASQNHFVEKYVVKHQEKFPEILNIYQAGLDGILRLSN